MKKYPEIKYSVPAKCWVCVLPFTWDGSHVSSPVLSVGVGDTPDLAYAAWLETIDGVRESKA